MANTLRYYTSKFNCALLHFIASNIVPLQVGDSSVPGNASKWLLWYNRLSQLTVANNITTGTTGMDNKYCPQRSERSLLCRNA